MFKLVALLFMVLDGVQADESYYTISNRNQFPTKEACLQYQETDKGKAAIQFIEDWASTQQTKTVVKFKCVPLNSEEI